MIIERNIKMSDVKEFIGEEIKKMKENAGCTFKRVFEVSSIPYVTQYRIERGISLPSLDTLRKYSYMFPLDIILNQLIKYASKQEEIIEQQEYEIAMLQEYVCCKENNDVMLNAKEAALDAAEFATETANIPFIKWLEGKKYKSSITGNIYIHHNGEWHLEKGEWSE